MCGRFGFIYPSAEDWAAATADLKYNGNMQAAFERELAKVQQRTNIAPTQLIPTMAFSEKDNEYKMVVMRWGYEPEWRPYGQLHNANYQTILDPEKRTWKKDFRERRCIIVASFTYDWQWRRDGTKVPWKVERADGKLMYLAGLYQYETIRSNRQEKVLTVAMMTTHGNRLFQCLNNDEEPGTMPVMLDPDKVGQWLDPNLKDPEEIAKLIRFTSDEEFKATPLQKVGNDNQGELPLEMEPIDPYDVDTEYYPEPSKERYKKPNPKKTPKKAAKQKKTE